MAKAKKVLRVTCESGTRLPMENVEPYQHELKKIDKSELLKLKRSIVRYGFTMPIAVWLSGGKYKLLDGHQRMKALKELAVEGYSIPKIPVTVVEAANRAEAKEKLLAMVSVYGKLDKAGLDHYVKDAGIQIELLQDVMNLPEIKFDTVSVKIKEKEQAETYVTEYEGMARIIVVYKGESQRAALSKRLGIEIKDKVFVYRFDA